MFSRPAVTNEETPDLSLIRRWLRASGAYLVEFVKIMIS
jgi:hypothetical protein